MENKEQRTIVLQDKKDSNELVWLFFVLIGFILFIVSFLEGKFPKRQLVSRYGVDKKTFNKWLYFFCSDLITDMEAYKRRRTISHQQYYSIITRLGDPNEHPILTKKAIIRHSGGTYNSLRKSVQKFPTRFGLPSYEAYISLKKFPPKISHQILIQFG